MVRQNKNNSGLPQQSHFPNSKVDENRKNFRKAVPLISVRPEHQYWSWFFSAFSVVIFEQITPPVETIIEEQLNLHKSQDDGHERIAIGCEFL